MEFSPSTAPLPTHFKFRASARASFQALAQGAPISEPRHKAPFEPWPGALFPGLLSLGTRRPGPPATFRTTPFRVSAQSTPFPLFLASVHRVRRPFPPCPPVKNAACGLVCVDCSSKSTYCLPAVQVCDALLSHLCINGLRL